ncbi:MAG: hypothetical protein IJN41_00470 [Firmicutes bacterium]|nr:hypothetical protein [Bacillota bacterium]
MSRFQSPIDSDTKRCAICQSRTPRASYFRGRYICDNCLALIKEQI